MESALVCITTHRIELTMNHNISYQVIIMGSFMSGRPKILHARACLGMWAIKSKGHVANPSQSRVKWASHK